MSPLLLPSSLFGIGLRVDRIGGNAPDRLPGVVIFALRSLFVRGGDSGG